MFIGTSDIFDGTSKLYQHLSYRTGGKTTCSIVNVSIVCDQPWHSNRQFNISSLSSQAVGRMPEGMCSICAPMLPPVPGDS